MHFKDLQRSFRDTPKIKLKSWRDLNHQNNICQNGQFSGLKIELDLQQHLRLDYLKHELYYNAVRSTYCLQFCFCGYVDWLFPEYDLVYKHKHG